ncbi:MAG: CocE/NonD family hydrolase [Solirubrobacterales bacterium]
MGAAVTGTLLFVATIMAFAIGATTADAGKQRQYKAPAVTTTLEATVRGSIGQIYIEGAAPGSTLLVVNPDGKVIRTSRSDTLGSKIFREVRPTFGYRVLQRQGNEVAGSRKFRVLRPGDNPSESYYENLPALEEGLNYVRMRDGVTLAVTVRLPIGKDIDDGPFPTVIEHSGYGTAAPGDLLASLLGGGGGGGLPAPDGATVIGSALAPLLGYASVSVQMRGSGCSGGAYDLFGFPTTYDGYDIVETVAAQDFSRGKVGLVGISYSGISQAFGAGTRPPNLGAIAPMSITTDIFNGTGYPGGIFNSGFALSWVQDRVSDARPAPEGGQSWARRMILDFNDAECLSNQKLRLQTLNVLDLIEDNPYRTPLLFDQRAPGNWLKRVDVPVFLTGQYQDEQTGGNFLSALSNLDGDPDVWIKLQNGVHNDSISPSTATQWLEFLEIFVAKEVPEIPGLFVGPSSPFRALLGEASDSIEQSAYIDLPNVSAAERAFRRDNSRVTLLMDNGAGLSGNGALGTTWKLRYNSWPPKAVKPRTLFLRPGGGLGARPEATNRQTVSYQADPDARPETNLVSGGVGAAQPNYNWAPLADGKGVGFTTAPLSRDMVIAGGSSVNAWLRSNALDTDLQVTLSEVRPDDKETYVQSGWLRASHRKLKPNGQNPLSIVPTHLSSDAAPLPSGRFTQVRVPIFPVAHAFRAGSKIRVTIMAPGGDRSIWEFATISDGETNEILLGGNWPASLTLPVLEGATALGTPLPDPTDLRGQPSRLYEVASNGG